jgi:predicted ABC-type ATPase
MNDPENTEQLASLYKKSGKLNDKKLDMFIKNRLGVVIEGTASSEKSYEWYHNKLISPLKEIGYDILVVGIYAPIHVCIKRNRNRGATGGRQIDASTMQSIFYGFIDEYYEIITKASKDLYDAVTILNTEFDDISKKKISNYVHMINHPNTVNKSKKKVLKRLNDFIASNVPGYITKVAAEDPDITGSQLTEMLVEFLKSSKEVRNCMTSLRVYQDMIDHNDKEQTLLKDSVEINSLDKIMRPFLEKNKKENIQKFDEQHSNN